MGNSIKEFRKKNKTATPYFHTDASQAPRYLSLQPNTLGVDLLSLDGSKIYGPKGVGILFIKDGTLIEPLFRGGGQERGIRSGTVNTPLVVGFAEALHLCEKRREADNKKLSALKEFFITSLLKKYPETMIHTPPSKSVSGIVSLSFPHIQSEELFIKLNTLGMYTSLGSACESEPPDLLPVHKKNTDALRISLGRETTKKEIIALCEALFAVLLRRDTI
jgi:cysteine desulfurase